MTNEEMWAGKLGDEYTERNETTQNYESRLGFFDTVIKKYKPKKVLEVGANAGYNMGFFERAVSFMNCYGIDVNSRAIEDAQECGLQVVYGSATDIPFKDEWFDLVFTAGVLIHIPPKEIKKAMAEIIRVSHKYVLCIEYYSQVERERPFLGEMGITWERPWNDLYTAMGLKIVEAGFLTQAEGFNDLSWWMFTK